MVRTQIIAIGDEVLNGKVLNTNAHWIAQELTQLGFYIESISVIPDDSKLIFDAIYKAYERFDLTIFTGGLGPTKDDLTKKVLASYFNCKMKTDRTTLEIVTKIFEERNLPMLEVNIEQAKVPERAKVLINNYGTAPGMVFEQNEKVIISLPGVPFEMKGIMQDSGFDYLKGAFHKESYYSKTFTVTGIGESFLADRISDWENRLRNDGLELAYLPGNFHIKLRITTKHWSEMTEQLIERYFEEFKLNNAEYYVGLENDTLSKVVGNLLKKNNWTIATMESCTAGGILNELVKTSGSSQYVKGGLVTYTNEMKVDLGKIDPELIEEYTELSQECAAEMAKNITQICNSNIGIGITGLLEKVIGNDRGTFAYISICRDGQTKTIFLKLGSNRIDNLKICIFAALNFLKNELL